MTSSAHLADAMRTHFEYFVALPDSRSEQLIAILRKIAPSKVLQVVDEATAVSIACGMTISSTSCAVIMESSGLRRAFEALGRLSSSHGIHPVLVVTDRGRVGDWEWWAAAHYSHARSVANALGARMADLTPDMSDADISTVVRNAAAHFRAQQVPLVLWCDPDLMTR